MARIGFRKIVIRLTFILSQGNFQFESLHLQNFTIWEFACNFLFPDMSSMKMEMNDHSLKPVAAGAASGFSLCIVIVMAIYCVKKCKLVILQIKINPFKWQQGQIFCDPDCLLDLTFTLNIGILDFVSPRDINDSQTYILHLNFYAHGLKSSIGGI